MIFDELVELLGGVELTARRLVEREQSVVAFAIKRLGGIPQAASQLGCSRQHLDELLKRPSDQWKGIWLKRLSEISKLSMDVLTESQAATRTVVKGRPQPPPSSKVKNKIQKH